MSSPLKTPRPQNRRLWLAGTTFTALTAILATSAAMFGLTAQAEGPPANAAPPATPVSVAEVQPSETVLVSVTRASAPP